MGYKPNLSLPTRQSVGLTTHVNYDKFNPRGEHIDPADRRKSLVDLDYSPLRRVTWASFYMGVLVSMGGFSACTYFKPFTYR
jgi:hypothetical protein